MKFEVDNQTLRDLEIFDSVRNKKSVFSLFNFTRSLGGKSRLYEFLSNPLRNLQEINERKNAIAFFQTLDIVLDIDKNTLDFIEHYLAQGDYPTKPPSKFRAIEKALQYKLNPSNQYYIIERGIDYIIDLFNSLHNFSNELQGYNCPELIQRNNLEIFRLFSLSEFIRIKSVKDMEKLSALEIAQFDYMFRYTHSNVVRFFLNLIYDYDVFVTVSQIAASNNYSFPDILPRQGKLIDIKGGYHPFIQEPVKNDVSFTSSNNLLFITGANMAGKSSLLKALSIIIYLGHVGFPVPASKCRMSLLSGIYTTINVFDNLNSGYSHFYSEVSRIKFIAERLQLNSNMFVVFDELFRSTNVKDAYDGSLSIISEFSSVNNCFFAISTHILEVGDALKDIKSINFKYMEVVNKDNSMHYTYLLKDGISDIRMGMQIIEKENVINIIKSISTPNDLDGTFRE